MQIQIHDLCKSYRSRAVLKHITLTFESGMIYGITGRNGSGKTMLLRAVAGLIKPTSGQILVNGKRLHKDLSFPPNMGILIDRPSFLNYASGFENLRMLGEIKGSLKDREIEVYLERFDLNPQSKQPVGKYSMGMIQKLGIIQAIMENQKLLILDEPFNALDEKAVEVLYELLRKFKEEGKLVILTSHHSEDIHSLCDVIYTIQDGEIVD